VVTDHLEFGIRYLKYHGGSGLKLAPDLLRYCRAGLKGLHLGGLTRRQARILEKPMLQLNRFLVCTFVLGTALSSPLLARSDWELLGTRKVSLTRQTDVIEVTRRNSRYDALRLEIDNGPLELFNLRVVFTSGESFSPATRINFGEGDQTRIIDLPGQARSIEKIVFDYKGPQRLGAATVRIYGRQAPAGSSAISPAPSGGSQASFTADGWTHMGARQVDFRSDHDVIRMEGQRKFNSILLAVEGADVEISNVSVNFANGEHFAPDLRLVFEENSRSRVIDLPGDARDIRNIEFRYRTLRRGGNDKAIVHVYGKTRSRTLSEEGWTHMGARQVDFRSDHDAIQVEGRKRFNTILLAVEGADVEISNVSVNFANGEHFAPELRLVFEQNSRSRFIDLPGEARDIKNIEFRYRTLRGGGNDKAIVHVYGKLRGEGR
jgi:hypothetical protein